MGKKGGKLKIGKKKPLREEKSQGFFAPKGKNTNGKNDISAIIYSTFWRSIYGEKKIEIRSIFYRFAVTLCRLGKLVVLYTGNCLTTNEQEKQSHCHS